MELRCVLSLLALTLTSCHTPRIVTDNSNLAGRYESDFSPGVVAYSGETIVIKDKSHGYHLTWTDYLSAPFPFNRPIESKYIFKDGVLTFENPAIRQREWLVLDRGNNRYLVTPEKGFKGNVLRFVKEAEQGAAANP